MSFKGGSHICVSVGHHKIHLGATVILDKKYLFVLHLESGKELLKSLELPK